MKKRVYPKNNREYFNKYDINAMLLFDMKKFMTEYLLPVRRIELYLLIPEQPAEKGKRCSPLFCIDEIHTVEFFYLVFTDHFSDSKNSSYKTVSYKQGYKYIKENKTIVPGK